MMANPKGLAVLVCVWDPVHTLERVRAQEKARADGSLAALVRKHGGRKDAVASAMAKARLTTVRTSLHGETHCPECGALMEEVFASPGIVDRVLAYEDVAADFDAAIERTRRLR